jgi:hypothetical protein
MEPTNNRFLVTLDTKNTSSTRLIFESWLNKTLPFSMTKWHCLLADFIMESLDILNKSSHMPKSS